jgi:hypothetical protein
MLTAGSSWRKQRSNQAQPQTTAGSREMTVARAIAPSTTSCAVRSPLPTSSVSAAATLRSISIGHLRYFFEQLGEYFRQYFFLGDRDEMPFNRATRGWVYRLAKNEGGIIGFGSTYRMHEAGALVFVNAPFPVLDEEQQTDAGADDRRRLLRQALHRRSIVNVSGMSFGAISKPAVRRCRAARQPPAAG